jgi:CRISPR/Cas system-associated exonuclease Cas4 (RecB family)
MAGLQCYKALYLSSYHSNLASPIDTSQQALFDMGTRVGELARDLYPCGVLVKESHFQHERAVISTQKLLQDPSVPAVYEAAFIYDDIRIRADILVRTDDNLFDLIEVKSSNSTKDEHMADVAVQLYVLKGCGVDIRRACLCHLNRKYVYPGGSYDVDQLFQIDDITYQAVDILPEIKDQLNDMRSMLAKSNPPDIKTGRQCSKPYDCSFYDYCSGEEPEHYILQLPGVRQKLLKALAQAEIEDIRDIPVDFPGLNDSQQRVRECVINNSMHLDPQISEELEQLDYPIHFLDFETFNPALPLYIGTSPYKIIPFQWSNHIREENGNIRHEEFLHDGFDDPREPFARSLLQSLGDEGSIVVYSSFEASRIKGLMQTVPHLSDELNELLARIVDLLKLVRAHCYHPEFHGSFSIKSVLSALVPDLGYGDLEINDGRLASIAYAEIVSPETKQDRRNHLRSCLLDYCKRDTEAEVQLCQKLSDCL